MTDFKVFFKNQPISGQNASIPYRETRVLDDDFKPIALPLKNSITSRLLPFPLSRKASPQSFSESLRPETTCNQYKYN